MPLLKQNVKHTIMKGNSRLPIRRGNDIQVMRKQVKKPHRMTQKSLTKKPERRMLKTTLNWKTLQTQNQIGNQVTRRMFSKIIITTVLRPNSSEKTQMRVWIIGTKFLPAAYIRRERVPRQQNLRIHNTAYQGLCRLYENYQLTRRNGSPPTL